MKKLCYFLFSLILSNLFVAQNTYNGKPRYEILATQNNATLGIINIELYQNIAPMHVRNFDSLVSKKFYDTTAFHRVVPGFVIQGGDPNSRSGAVNTWGFGQPGQPTVKAEFTAAKHLRGTISAARSTNINSATSQFFVCVANTPNLDGAYSVYGRVTSGMSVVDAIVASPTVVGTQRPVQKVEMFIRFIGVNDTVAPPANLIAPKNDSLAVDTNVVILKWSATQGALIYHVDVARDSLFTDTVKSQDLVGLQYSALFLPSKTKYFWKVKVNNGGFFTDSEVRHFTTGPKQATVNTTGLVDQNNLHSISIFPNPSKDKFSFSGMKGGERIVVRDLSGKMVLEVVATQGNILIDLQNKVVGTYLYEVWSNSSKLNEGKLILDR